MKLTNRRIGFAMTGSHCNLAVAPGVAGALLAEGAEVIPIVSEAVATTDTRFGFAADWIEELTHLTGHIPLKTIPEVEPIGPQGILDVLLVCPCTGNTLAKIANAITDTVVSMAAKAQLRNGRPVVLAITSNDILGLNARNLGALLPVHNVYFVPFAQDSPLTKPGSITADWRAVVPTLVSALNGRQLQPLLLQQGKAPWQTEADVQPAAKEEETV